MHRGTTADADVDVDVDFDFDEDEECVCVDCFGAGVVVPDDPGDLDDLDDADNRDDPADADDCDDLDNDDLDRAGDEADPLVVVCVLLGACARIGACFRRTFAAAGAGGSVVTVGAEARGVEVLFDTVFGLDAPQAPSAIVSVSPTVSLRAQERALPPWCRPGDDIQ